MLIGSVCLFLLGALSAFILIYALGSHSDG